MSRRSRSRSTPQARRTATASRSSVNASSRCSSVAYSWRRSLACARARCSDFSRLRDSTPAYPSWRNPNPFPTCTATDAVLPGEVHDLGHLGFGNLVSIDAAHTNPAAMHVQHDARRFLPALIEEPLQDMNDELHRRVVVIQHKHFVHRRFFGFRLRLDDNAGSRSFLAALSDVAHVDPV